MSFFRKLIPRVLERFLGRLRFPGLFVLTALLFAVDVFVPDAIPFVDEILLALGTLMLGRLRKRGKDDEAVEEDEALEEGG